MNYQHRMASVQARIENSYPKKNELINQSRMKKHPVLTKKKKKKWCHDAIPKVHKQAAVDDHFNIYVFTMNNKIQQFQGYRKQDWRF